MKKITLLLVFLMSAAILLSGCAVITNILDPLPDEYVDGVKYSRDYPDKELEIYDDAIVFEAEEDDDEIVIKYGTEDEIDDVIDFYEDLFDDNGLTVDESDDGKDEYYAAGSGDGYKFEINAEEASGNYEERAFATVVEVVITPYELGEEILAKIQGFWLICGTAGELSDDFRMYGQAIDFDGQSMDFYDNFEPDTSNNVFTFLDDDTINYTEEGDEYTVDISFDTVDGVDVLVMTVDGTSIYLEKTTYDGMMEYKDMGGQVVVPDNGNVILLSDYISDADLEYLISDVDWYATYIYYPDGTYDYSDFYNRLFLSSYYTGEDEFEDEYYEMSWYIFDSYIYLYYDDGESYSFLIDYEFDGTYGYLYLFDPELGYTDTALVYTNFG